MNGLGRLKMVDEVFVFGMVWLVDYLWEFGYEFGELECSAL